MKNREPISFMEQETDTQTTVKAYQYLIFAQGESNSRSPHLCVM